MLAERGRDHTDGVSVSMQLQQLSSIEVKLVYSEESARSWVRCKYLHLYCDVAVRILGPQMIRVSQSIGCSKHARMTQTCISVPVTAHSGAELHHD